jgi:hypothetical protein
VPLVIIAERRSFGWHGGDEPEATAGFGLAER